MSFQNPSGYWYHQGSYRIVTVKGKEKEILEILKHKGVVFEEDTTLWVPGGMLQRSQNNFNFYDSIDPVHHFVIPDDWIEVIYDENKKMLWWGPSRLEKYLNDF